MKMNELKGSINLMNLQLIQLAPVFDLITQISDAQKSENVLEFLEEQIHQKYIKTLEMNIDKKLSQYVLHQDFADTFSGVSKLQDTNRLAETLERVEQRSERTTEQIMRIEDNINDTVFDINTLRKSINTKVELDDFSNFKKSVDVYYATKEHIKSINTKLTTCSTVDISKSLEQRLNKLSQRLSEDYHPKYEVTDLFKKSEATL